MKKIGACLFLLAVLLSSVSCQKNSADCDSLKIYDDKSLSCVHAHMQSKGYAQEEYLVIQRFFHGDAIAFSSFPRYDVVNYDLVPYVEIEDVDAPRFIILIQREEKKGALLSLRVEKGVVYEEVTTQTQRDLMAFAFHDWGEPGKMLGGWGRSNNWVETELFYGATDEPYRVEAVYWLEDYLTGMDYVFYRTAASGTYLAWAQREGKDVVNYFVPQYAISKMYREELMEQRLEYDQTLLHEMFMERYKDQLDAYTIEF